MAYNWTSYAPTKTGRVQYGIYTSDRRLKGGNAPTMSEAQRKVREWKLEHPEYDSLEREEDNVET